MRRLSLLCAVLVCGCAGESPGPVTVGAPPNRGEDAGTIASECAADSDCDGGVCVVLPGCNGPHVTACAPKAFVPPGAYCDCDGGLFTRNADGTGEPFRAWQGLEACGFDAGPPPRTWREFSWGERYDSAGVRVRPRLRPLGVPLKLTSAQANKAACAGDKVVLLPPAGTTLPATKGLHRAFVGCGHEVAITQWTPTRVTLAVPPSAAAECVWLAEATEEDAALLAAACAKRLEAFADGPFAAPDRCQRVEGAALNLLHRAPDLQVSAFGSAGRPDATDGGLVRLFTAARASFSWDAGGAPVELWIKGQRKPRATAGEELIEGEADLRWVAKNECGESVKRFNQTAKASFSLGGKVALDEGEGEMEVWLDEAPTTRTTLRVDKSKLPIGVTVPDTVVVEPGALRAKVKVKSTRGLLAPLGGVRLSGPGFTRSDLLELRSVMPPRGFADLHVHMFSNRGFGTTGFYGRPDGPLQNSLHECSEVHGPNGFLDFINFATKTQSLPMKYWTLRHDTQGANAYGGWPDALDYTHQQVHYTALQRAWDGGLRLMVMLAVNNSTACTFSPHKGRSPCDDLSAMRRQLDAVHDFAASDEARLPDGRAWFRIVGNADEARDAITQGQLAVVLGVELDNLLDCNGGPCTEQHVDALVSELYARDVRHVFPAHFATNAFAGEALYNGLTTSPSTGSCPGEYDYGRCNRQGLTALGKYFIGKLMERKMIIDLDHQSALSRDGTLQLARARKYPLVSGHAWMWALMKHDARHEGTLTTGQQREVYELGGIVGVLTNHSDHLADMGEYVDASGRVRIPQMCGKSVEAVAQAILEASRVDSGFHAVAFGSDFNGFAGQPSGRGTGNPKDDERACVGSKKVASWTPDKSTQVTYPFQDSEDFSFDRSAFGARLYDINTDGFAHIGMYPDLLEALRKLGMTDTELAPVMYSADGYVRMWERIDK